jgi:RNA polymerase sigma factor (TIGR02999 family)
LTTTALDYEGHIRRLLAAVRAGDRASFDALIDAVGHEMRRLSAYHLRHPPADVKTLQTTALVHEAIIRLIQALNREAGKFPETREHFMALASKMMRFTLIDHVRKRKLQLVCLDEPLRTGDGAEDGHTIGDTLADWGQTDLEGLLAVHEALAEVERLDPEYGTRRGAALALRLFGGMNYHEIAEELGITDDMARRDCQIALGRLQAILASGQPPAALAT